MKKASIGMYVILLVAMVGLIFPPAGFANQKVDSSGCLACHELGVFGAGDGSIHGSHVDCAACHEGAPGAGNVASSACLACHPASGSDQCDLVGLHENSTGYTPSGASCLDCHGNCGGSTTTTTPPTGVRGNRYEIFLIGPFREGCRSATAQFRSDNVLVLDCLDGFGWYLSFGNTFTAIYWSNNYYLGYSLGMMVTGFAINPYIVAGGLSYFGNIMSTVVITGYIL